jgi:hypothetical protein
MDSSNKERGFAIYKQCRDRMMQEGGRFMEHYKKNPIIIGVFRNYNSLNCPAPQQRWLKRYLRYL